MANVIFITAALNNIFFKYYSELQNYESVIYYKAEEEVQYDSIMTEINFSINFYLKKQRKFSVS